MTDELVLVVPTADVIERLGGGAAWLGIRQAGEDDLATVIRERGAFRARSEMEADPSWKQVIPYPVLRDGDQGLRTALLRKEFSVSIDAKVLDNPNAIEVFRIHQERRVRRVDDLVGSFEFFLEISKQIGLSAPVKRQSRLVQ